MIALVKRNLKVFFRDKSAVFFSLLALLIIIGLYVLFLGDTLANSLEGVENGRFLMDSWITAGLMASSSVTATMGAFGIMVEDRNKKLLKDFSSSPLSRKSLAAGYILSSYLVGVIISVIALVLCEIYIIANGGGLLPGMDILKTFACIALSVLASSSMVFFLVSFFKSPNAFAAASTVIGTVVGFLTGIYIPIGNLPVSMQFIIKIFPVSHAAALFRQIIMETPISLAFANVPAETALDIQKRLGVFYAFGDNTLSGAASVLILAATSVVFYVLAIINISRKQR